MPHVINYYKKKKKNLDVRTLRITHDYDVHYNIIIIYTYNNIIIIFFLESEKLLLLSSSRETTNRICKCHLDYTRINQNNTQMQNMQIPNGCRACVRARGKTNCRR